MNPYDDTSKLKRMTYILGPWDGEHDYEPPEFCVEGHQRIVCIGQTAHVYEVQGAKFVHVKSYRPARDEDCQGIDYPKEAA